MIPDDNKPGIESVKRICTNPVRRSTARESKKGETNGARQSGQSGFLPVQKLPLAGVPLPPLLSLHSSMLLTPFGQDSNEFTWQQAASLRASHGPRGLLFPPLLHASSVHTQREEDDLTVTRETAYYNFLARVRSGFVLCVCVCSSSWVSLNKDRCWGGGRGDSWNEGISRECGKFVTNWQSGLWWKYVWNWGCESMYRCGSFANNSTQSLLFSFSRDSARNLSENIKIRGETEATPWTIHNREFKEDCLGGGFPRSSSESKPARSSFGCFYCPHKFP